jgi:hypothetical protein
MDNMIPVRTSIGGIGNLMFKHAYIWAQMRDQAIPDVYVQGKKYWEKYESEIRAMFGAGIEPINMVSLQIRRGDYLSKEDFYVNLGETDYYQEAVEHFPDHKFLVFCYDRQDPKVDKKDREWTVKFLDSFIPRRYELWEPKSETEDMNTMAGCEHNIMANGSFSWWAAYLNPNPNKKVICPKQWFTDGVQRCELLDEWIKL